MAQTLSQKIEQMAHQCEGRREMMIQEVLVLSNPLSLAVLSLVTLILSLPFILFLKIPGISLFFGALIFIQGIRMAVHKNLWLPNKARLKIVSGDRVAKRLLASVGFLKRLEKYIHPRGTIYQQHPLWQTFNGWVMALGGFFLLLPGGFHFIPGIGVFLLSIGLLEEDMVWMGCAYAVFSAHAALLITLSLLR